MIYMRGQAADYDGWRQLGLEGWGWDDVLPYFMRHEDHHGGAERLARGGRRMAGRAPARFLADPRRGARRRGRDRHPQDRRLQSRRQRRLGLFRGQPAPRAALERGARVPEADPQAAEPASGDRRACRADAVRGPPRDRRALQRRTARAARRARAARSFWRPARSARRNCSNSPASAGRSSSRRLARPVVHALAGRRREPAGPSAAQGHLRRPRRAHAQCRLSVAVQAGADGARLRASPARADDHGALAARPVRQVLARLRAPPMSSSMSSRCRSTGSASRCTLFRRSRSASATCGRRAAARAMPPAPIRAPRR